MVEVCVLTKITKKSITAGYASIKVDIFCQISFQSPSDSLTAENRLRH